MAKRTARKSDTTGNLGFETKLRAAADALRDNMDAAEYKHAELEGQRTHGADREDPDEYRAARIFWGCCASDPEHFLAQFAS